MQRSLIFIALTVLFVGVGANAGADFSDDFESGTLDNWTIDGRQLGSNFAGVVERGGSQVAYLYHSSFTEIYMYHDFGYDPEDTYQFDLEVDTSGGGSGAFYAFSFAGFNFLDATSTNLGGVGYGSATTSYPFDQWAALPTAAGHVVPENVMSHYELSVADMLSEITIDESQIAGVRMYAYTYASAWGPYTAQLWLDNVQLNPDATNGTGTTVPAPGALLLGGIGAGLIGWLRRRRTI